MRGWILGSLDGRVKGKKKVRKKVSITATQHPYSITQLYQPDLERPKSRPHSATTPPILNTSFNLLQLSGFHGPGTVDTMKYSRCNAAQCDPYEGIILSIGVSARMLNSHQEWREEGAGRIYDTKARLDARSKFI